MELDRALSYGQLGRYLFVLFFRLTIVHFPPLELFMLPVYVVTAWPTPAVREVCTCSLVQAFCLGRLSPWLAC